MKQFIHLLVLLLAIMLPAKAVASSTVVDGIYYNFNTYSWTATVTFKGGSYDQYPDYYTGDLVIPDSVVYGGNTYAVAAISTRAFSASTGLTSIVMPNTITTIGEYAFIACTGLKSVTLSNSLKTIQRGAFYNCNQMTDINLPASLTTIDESAFFFCDSLHNLNIPKSLKTIGYNAFAMQ